MRTQKGGEIKMKSFMSAIFTFIIISWIIYTPSYFLFFDTAEEKLENTKLEDIYHIYKKYPEDEEKIKKELKFIEKKYDVRISKTLKSSLKSWGAENLKKSSIDLIMKDYKKIKYSFFIEENKLSIHALGIERNIIRTDRNVGPFSYILAISEIECQNDHGHSSIKTEEEIISFLISIYSKTKTNALHDAINFLCPVKTKKSKKEKNISPQDKPTEKSTEESKKTSEAELILNRIGNNLDYWENHQKHTISSEDFLKSQDIILGINEDWHVMQLTCSPLNSYSSKELYSVSFPYDSFLKGGENHDFFLRLIAYVKWHNTCTVTDDIP